MLRRRLLPVLALAAGLGLLTSYLVYTSVRAATDPNRETTEVAVTTANIGIGEALTSRHYQVVRWPSASLPGAPLAAPKTIEGRVAKASFYRGEPILEAKLAPPGQGGLMPMMVPPGKRAVTIKVDEAAQKSGFLLPNSHVDVLVTMARSVSGAKESRVVLQDVVVLAADQTVETKDNRPVTMTTVTLLLTPAESERLALAQNEGKVTMAIRNMTDASVVPTAGVTTAQLMGSAPPAPAKAAGTAPRRKSVGSKPLQETAKPVPALAPPAPTHTVSVIRGVTVAEQVFVKDKEKGWVEPAEQPEPKAKPKP
jgi:pilus assembly protein CpaB